MNLWQYVTADPSLEPQGLTEGLAERFSQLVAHGHSIADLLAHYADDFGHIPAPHLIVLHQARRRFLTWQKRRGQIDDARTAAGLPPLPHGVLSRATAPHQLDAAARTARCCPRDSAADDPAWVGVLKAGVELWDRCLGVARKEGTLRCVAVDPADPQLARYDDYARATTGLADLAPHRWLAMRRGEREGLLRLELELPRDQLFEQLELLKSRLGPAAVAREAGSLLDELVLDDLPAWLKQILDVEAETQAIDAACAALGGLLNASPLQARRLGAIYLTRAGAPAAVIVANREGDLVAQKVLKAAGQWTPRAVEVLKEAGAHQVVVPTGTVEPELLPPLENALADAGLQVVKVRAAALAEARGPLTRPPHRLGASVASALVLARRALDPLKEWSTVDPVSIGVAEYQGDLDAERLRAALRQTVELCRLERRRGKSAHMGAPVARGNAAMARLNPLVKTLADLRPGMSVNGVVTNISHFGAFVNIGLQQEGLAHISELSDEFVSDPNEVVRIGQQVTAHVLQVDTGRGRISLSLKQPRAQPERGGRGRGGGPAAPRPPKSKAEALASLERLFKK